MGVVSVRVVTEPAEFDALLPAWRQLADAYENDPDLFRLVLGHRDNVLSPFVLVAEEGGVPVAILPGRLETITLRARFAYFDAARFRVRSVSLIHNGLIGRRDPGTLEALVGAAMPVIAGGRAEILNFRYLAEGSALEDAVARLPVPRRRRRTSAPECRRILDLPESVDALLQDRSAKSRKRLRYYARQVEALDGFEVRVVEDAADLPALMEEIEAVAARTYQRSLGAGFQNNAEWAAVLRHGFDGGRFRLWLVYGEGKLITYSGGFTVGQRFLLHFKGYDPDYARLSVGTYLLLRMVGDLIDGGQVRELDYGFGDAEYKRTFSNASQMERNHILFAPGLKGEAMALILRALEGLTDRAQRIARKLGAEQRLKTLLRRQLSGPGRSSADS